MEKGAKCTCVREPLARHSYGKCHATALHLHGCSYSHDILFSVPVDRVLLLLLLLPLPLPRPPPPPPRCLGRGHLRRFTEVRFIGAAWCGACAHTKIGGEGTTIGGEGSHQEKGKGKEKEEEFGEITKSCTLINIPVLVLKQCDSCGANAGTSLSCWQERVAFASISFSPTQEKGEKMKVDIVDRARCAHTRVELQVEANV